MNTSNIVEDDYKLFTHSMNIINNLADNIIEQYNIDKTLAFNHIISALSNDEDYYSIIYKITNNIKPTSSLDKQTMTSILNNLQKYKEI